MDLLLDILRWVIIGSVMGVAARIILPGEQKIGLVPTILVGAGGAFIGAIVGKNVFNIDVSGFNLLSILAAVIGALIVLILWCFVAKKMAKG